MLLSCRAHIYGGSNKAGATSWEVRRAGKKGQVYNLRVGHLGNLADQRVTLAMQQEPAWQPIATNSDAKSVTQASAVAGILDYYYREQRFERCLRQAADDMQWSGEGFIFSGWDPRKGELAGVDPDTGEQIKEGDLYFRSPDTLDVARDVKAKSYASSPWKTVREPTNKWDLAARYPDKADDILSTGNEQDGRLADYALRSDGTSGTDSDETFIYHFVHERTDAMPEGRYTVTVGSGVVLFDGPLPYRTSPLKRQTEKEMKDVPFGWTATFDAVGLQEVVDALNSAILTQQMNHAVRKIVGVKGSGLAYKQLSEGLAYLEVNSMDQRPVPLDFADVSPQVFQFRQTAIQEMQMFMGVNDVQRGVVNPNLKSGAHAALYDAIALRSSTRLQKAIVALAEDVGTFIIHALVDFAGDSERIASIAGEANRPKLVAFKGSELEGFDRVVVEATNHAAKTVTGKQAIADALLEKGALGQGEIAGQRYVQLLKTGELEQMTEAPMSNALRIKRDKELLAKGIGLAPKVPVVDPLTGGPAIGPNGLPIEERRAEVGQDGKAQQHVATHVAQSHWADIPEYLSVLSSPEALADDGVVAAVLELVQEKLNLWRSMDPDLLALLGGPVPPSQSMTMPPPGGARGGNKPPSAGGTSKTPNPGQMPDGTDSPAKQPSLPKMPGSGGQTYQPDNPESLPQ